MKCVYSVKRNVESLSSGIPPTPPAPGENMTKPQVQRAKANLSPSS